MMRHSTWVLPLAAPIAAALIIGEPTLAQQSPAQAIGHPAVKQLSQPELPVSSTRQATTLQAVSRQHSVETRTERRRLWRGISEFENRFGDRGFRYELARF